MPLVFNIQDPLYTIMSVVKHSLGPRPLDRQSAPFMLSLIDVIGGGAFGSVAWYPFPKRRRATAAEAFVPY